MASETSFIQIPGNIKQSLTPFNLNPQMEINKPKVNSLGLDGASPQFFTFRPSHLKNKNGLLGICPASFAQFVQDDMSYQLLYKRNDESGEIEKDSIDINSIFNSIPGIQVREFLPDTALNMILNFYTKLKEAISQNKVAGTDAKDQQTQKNVEQQLQAAKEDKEGKSKVFGKNAYKAAVWMIKYICCAVDPNFISDLGDSLPPQQHWYGGADKKHRKYVLQFPYLLYYTFLSSVTTNLYELPCNIQGNTMYSSDGNPGWSAGAMELPLPKDGIVGKLATTLLGNVRVNYLSPWDAEEGHKTMPEGIVITFDLYNDTAESAENNFIFVNTLIPNNKWIQYNLFQHSSSLYDIKIEGHNRLFACTGKFKVTYKGILRDPSKFFLNELVSKFKSSNATFRDSDLIKNKIIKIPDIYSVEMTFQSILPDNFNTWMHQYSNNVNQIEEYKDTSYVPSSVETVLKKSIDTAVERFKGYWKDGVNVNFPE